MAFLALLILNTRCNYACDQSKPITSQQIALKHTSPHHDTGQRIPFVDTCQLTITWMSTINLNTDCMSWTLVANNARSLQGNCPCSAANQRGRTIVAV